MQNIGVVYLQPCQKVPGTAAVQSQIPQTVESNNPQTIPEKKKNGKVIKPTGREVILNVLKICDLERTKDALIKPLDQFVSRTAIFTGISEETIKSINDGSWKPKRTEALKKPLPKKMKLSPRCKTVLDDRDIMNIKNLIRDYHIQYCKIPSLNDLLPHVLDQISTNQDNITFLHRVLHHIGYRRKKLHTKKAVLVENSTVVACRDEYLKIIRDLRNKTKNIIYIYECIIDKSLILNKTWVQKYSDNAALRGKQTYTLICAASINGFLKKATLLCKTSIDETLNGFCGQLTSSIFEKWLKTNLIPHLPRNSIIIMDNAPHHFRVVDKPLSYYASKCEMVDYLKQKNVECNDKMRRTKLYQLIQDNIPKGDVYVVDDILGQHQHKVLRLPPYMIDLSPTQLAMDQVQQKLCENDHYRTFNLKNITETMQQVMSSLTQEDWQTYFDKARSLEDYYWGKNIEFDVAYDKIMKNMRECVGSESEESSEESDDDL